MDESLSKCEVIDLYSLATLSIASDIKILFEGKKPKEGLLSVKIHNNTADVDLLTSEAALTYF